MIVTCRRQGTDEHIPRRRRPLARAAHAAQARRARARRSASRPLPCRVSFHAARAPLLAPVPTPAPVRPSQPVDQVRNTARRGLLRRVLPPRPATLPTCCQWPGVDHAYFLTAAAGAASTSRTPDQASRHTRSAAARRTPAAGPPPPGQLPCLPCPTGREALRPQVLRQGQALRERPPLALLQQGQDPLRPERAASRAHVQTPALRFAASQVSSVAAGTAATRARCAPAGHAAARVAGAKCGPELCCDKRIEVCAPVGEQRTDSLLLSEVPVERADRRRAARATRTPAATAAARCRSRTRTAVRG